jgi:putative endonuclease
MGTLTIFNLCLVYRVPSSFDAQSADHPNDTSTTQPSLRQSPPIGSRSSPSDIGQLGEELVAAWLVTQGWTILHRRWRCRWGELDLIAKSGARSDVKSGMKSGAIALPMLAFIEVKVRSRGSWDANGLLAITPQKQAKLWQAAQLFLASHSKWIHAPCRFDVALVSSRQAVQRPIKLAQLTAPSMPLPLQNQRRSELERPSQTSAENSQPVLSLPTPVHLGDPIEVAGYQLTLQQYIEHAFEEHALEDYSDFTPS